MICHIYAERISSKNTETCLFAKISNSHWAILIKIILERLVSLCRRKKNKSSKIRLPNILIKITYEKDIKKNLIMFSIERLRIIPDFKSFFIENVL